MLIVSPYIQSNKPRILASICAYCDTLEIFSRQKPEPGVMIALRNATGRCIWYEKIKDFGYRTIVNQPTVEAIRILQRWFDGCRGVSVCRAHIALDFDPTPGCYDQVADLVKLKIHQRYRRDSDHTHEYEGTLYSIQTAGRPNRPSVLTAFYQTGMGKLDGECEKIHFEVRLEKKRAVIAAGITHPTDLLTLSVRQFVQQRLVIADHDHALQKLTQKIVTEITSRTKPNPQYDIAKRVTLLLRRLGAETLTGFKSLFPRQFERLKRLGVFVIPDELQWVPRAGNEKGSANVSVSLDAMNVKGTGGECVEMMPLLHAARPPRLRIRIRPDDLDPSSGTQKRPRIRIVERADIPAQGQQGARQ
jgi:hypothetical protein